MKVYAKYCENLLKPLLVVPSVKLRTYEHLLSEHRSIVIEMKLRGFTRLLRNYSEVWFHWAFVNHYVFKKKYFDVKY